MAHTALSYIILSFLVILTFFGYIAVIKKTDQSSIIHRFSRTFMLENSTVIPVKQITEGLTCKKITLYDSKLLKYANRGYGHLIIPKCLHKGFKPRTDLKPMVPKDCKGPSIHTESNGRLGNQICEYLTIKYFERYFKVPITVSNRVAEMVQPYFTPGGEMVYNLTCTGSHIGISVHKLFEKLIKNYDDPKHHPLDDIKGNMAIGGYPCPMDILMDKRHDISKLVNFKKNISKKAKKHLLSALASKNFTREDNVVISIHVRRTDYNWRLEKKFNRTYLTPCYYKQAMHHYQLMFDNPVFVVASDDLKWCKEYLDGPRVVFLEHNKDIPPMLDMAATSLCDHHIFGYGTFGFLGAYFGRTGYIIHSFVLDKKIVEFENDLLCSDSDRLIAIPDMGYN